MRKRIPFGRMVFSSFGAWLIFGQTSAQAQSNTCSSPLSDIHYSKYTVVEGSVYTETNPGPAILQTNNANYFIAEVDLKTNYSATSAQLIIPNGSPQPMIYETSRI